MSRSIYAFVNMWASGFLLQKNSLVILLRCGPERCRRAGSDLVFDQVRHSYSSTVSTSYLTASAKKFLDGLKNSLNSSLMLGTSLRHDQQQYQKIG
jgi:hypothetical protein